MFFSDIKPFIRYVHYITSDENSVYNFSVPYDNRCFFAYRGNGTIQIETEVYEMDEGDIVLIPSGTKYRILLPKSKVTYIAVNFDYTQSNLHKTKPIPPIDEKGYDPYLKLENVNFSDMESFNGIVHIKGLSSLSGKFLKLQQEYVKKFIYFEKFTSSIFSEILIGCVRAVNNQKFTENSETIQRIIGFVNENYNRQLSNKTIAEEFNLHPNYISSMIKIFTGMPLHQYLMRVRISHSIEMLHEKNHSISEISEKCGFCSIYHFSKTFTKIVGIPPSKY